ncbi:hypothetical protein G4O51_12245 [Candidatus Bathyarchaeota archaeon A05DMB-2]|nr:hypothetical protein [Candidatus Bathyarchaeota archaeon A05DMB-2]
MVKIPWEETDQYIRSGHRNPEDFEPDSLRTITLSEEEGIKAIIGKPKGKDTTEVQSYLFDRSKTWNLEKAKEWFEQHCEDLKPVKEHVHVILPFKVLEKIVDKPLRIRGIAITSGMSRNFNIYTPEELQGFANKLVSAPIYVEHVAVPNAVGKVVKTDWDGQNLWYEAEVYDEEVAEKIRKGLIQHVSVGADYETIDVLDGKVPHGLHNAELSLVAVPGIPETNIKVLEKLVHPNEEELKRLVEAQVKAILEAEQKRLKEAEWDTAYINDLPDSAFAVISKGGTKDEQSKTVPRTLRHLPHHKTDGSLDIPHLRNALARLSQTDLSPEEHAEAKRHLCAHAKESDIESEFCKETESCSIAETLLKKPTEPTIPISEAIRILESLLPSPAVERSTMGMQRECQEIRQAIFKLKERMKNA